MYKWTSGVDTGHLPPGGAECSTSSSGGPFRRPSSSGADPETSRKTSRDKLVPGEPLSYSEGVHSPVPSSPERPFPSSRSGPTGKGLLPKMTSTRSGFRSAEEPKVTGSSSAETPLLSRRSLGVDKWMTGGKLSEESPLESHNIQQKSAPSIARPFPQREPVSVEKSLDGPSPSVTQGPSSERPVFSPRDRELQQAYDTSDNPGSVSRKRPVTCLSADTEHGVPGGRVPGGRTSTPQVSGRTSTPPVSGRAGGHVPWGRTSTPPVSGRAGGHVPGGRTSTPPVSGRTYTPPVTGRTSTPPVTGRTGGETADNMSEADVVNVRTRPTDEDDQPQVLLSVVWQGGKLGAALYEVETTLISMMPDSAETDNFSILNQLLLQLQPSCVVVSSKLDDRLLKALQPTATEGAEWSSEFVTMLPSIDFCLETSKRRILSLSLPSVPASLSDSERTVYISSLVPFENTNMVRAMGGLLKLLDKRRVGVELEDSDVRVPVLGLNVFSLRDQVLLDENTYSALQIFHREDHPSVYKVGHSNSSKEGFSLFGVMNRCRSQVGSRLLRLWFLRPSQDICLLRERQAAITFFMNPRNAEATNNLQDCLKNIKNVTRIVARMGQSQASLGDWQALYKTAYNAIYIGDICRSQSANITILHKIGQVFTEDLHRIANLISKIVDFDESAVQNRFVVKPGVDPELDEKKRTYSGLPDLMTKVAREELNKLDEEITSCNVIYLPQLGYLLAVPQTDAMRDADNHIDDLEFKFASNRMAHYKSASTTELDSLLGDTQCDITDRETSIMHRLQNILLEHTKVLVDVMSYAAQLDCLLSLASCAQEGNYVCPDLSNGVEISIKGGRHPLQELCCSPYVPNDTLSGRDWGKVKVLTGPNACGKSVYLKQVALIVYLAQIGSFVPAECARIGLVDGIYSRIHTMESVSVGLSTFMIDINQVSHALRCATQRSLVLLDEFGKGTQSDDGLALLCAVMKYWLSQGEACPHILMTTHFHSLLTQNLLPPSPLLKYQTMDVLHDDADLVFLYQLVEGSTNMSYACHIAAVAGLPQELINRGKQVTGLLRQHRPIPRMNRD